MISPDAQQLDIPGRPALVLPERRLHPRYPMRISLVVKTLDIDTHEMRCETFQAWTEDISTNGTRIICPQMPLTGQFWINLRTRRLRKHWFEVDPIWSNGVTTTRGPRQRVGISFLKPLDREELDRMLVARALSQLRASMPQCRS